MSENRTWLDCDSFPEVNREVWGDIFLFLFGSLLKSNVGDDGEEGGGDRDDSNNADDLNDGDASSNGNASNDGDDLSNGDSSVDGDIFCGGDDFGDGGDASGGDNLIDGDKFSSSSV